jgi:uncharacterized protein (TIGR02996 family)
MTRPSARTLTEPSDTYLARAREALVKQDFAAARDLLIGAWRLRRVPAIASFVDVVATRAPDALTEQLGAVIAARVAASEQNWQVVRELDDPRVSRFAIDALLKLPFQGPSARPLLTAFVDVIDQRKDARLVDASRTILAGVATRVTPAAAREELGEAIKRVTAVLRDDTPDTTVEEDAQLAEIAKLLEPLQQTTRSAEALLADVYANPEDDAPRMVLADLLMERGDPRGEFIALQIERARTGAEPSARELQLQKKHGKQWLGALAPVLSWGKGYAKTTFRRGFVAKADIILSVGKKLDPIKRDLAWTTVEELDGPSWPFDLLWTAPLRALRRIDRGLSAEDLARIAKRPLHGVRSIRFDVASGIDAVALRAAFPKIERLVVHHQPEQALAMYEPYGCYVETIASWHRGDLDAARARFDAYVESLVGKQAPIPGLVLAAPRGPGGASDAAIELRRGAHGRFERV